MTFVGVIRAPTGVAGGVQESERARERRELWRQADRRRRQPLPSPGLSVFIWKWG